jgi:hypothetical protein
MQAGIDETQRHIVVFDCNVYLDVACIVGPPFSWQVFESAVAHVAQDKLPHPDDRAYDSLRAIAGCTSGRFAGSETLEVWTNAHIDKIVRGKAMQPVEPDAVGYRGLGWARNDAQSLVDDLVHGIAAQSNGGTLGGHYPDGNPPLDHEDGMVYGACKALASADPLAIVYCVTRDRGFVAAYRNNQLDNHTIVLTPSAFVALFRKARTYYSMQRMRPPGNNS